MVMARELSLNEMKRIREETGMELEAFVHGALCYCYSGQCLFSSMLGGRSGNRGRCAQPCRLPYAVLDEKHREYKKDAYVLSLKDMCGIKDLRGLADAGNRSRMLPVGFLITANILTSFYRDRRHRFRKETTGQCLRWETAVDLPTDITTGTMVLIW